MVRDTYGNVVWLSLSDFIDKLLPVPRRLLSTRFPAEHMEKINSALGNTLQNYEKRAEEHNRIPEDQLASDFVSAMDL